MIKKIVFTLFFSIACTVAKGETETRGVDRVPCGCTGEYDLLLTAIDSATLQQILADMASKDYRVRVKATERLRQLFIRYLALIKFSRFEPICGFFSIDRFIADLQGTSRDPEVRLRLGLAGSGLTWANYCLNESTDKSDCVFCMLTMIEEWDKLMCISDNSKTRLSPNISACDQKFSSEPRPNSKLFEEVAK